MWSRDMRIKYSLAVTIDHVRDHFKPFFQNYEYFNYIFFMKRELAICE